MSVAISVENVSKNFGTKQALINVSLNVEAGQIFGFLGPNGAGKTTAIRVLMDYIRPSSGRVSLLDGDARLNSAQLKAKVGYLSSDMQLHDNWTARDHIGIIGDIRGNHNVRDLIKQFGLDMDTKVRHLSSGNKQKLAIILAFIGEPRLLIMDEPSRGLDPLLQNQLYDLLKKFAQNGGSVFLSSHNLGEVQQLCDRVAVIKEGKIIAAEAMDDIRQMQVHVIQAVADSAFKAADFKHKDIQVVSRDDNKISLKARGQLDVVLKALAKYKLADLEVSHVSLEDVFLEYY